MMPRPARACPVLDTRVTEQVSPPEPVSNGSAMSRATASAKVSAWASLSLMPVSAPGFVNHAGQRIRRLRLDALRPGFDSGTKNAGCRLAKGALRPGSGYSGQATLRRRTHYAQGRVPQRKTPDGAIGARRQATRVMFSRTKQPFASGRTPPWVRRRFDTATENAEWGVGGRRSSARVIFSRKANAGEPLRGVSWGKW